MNINKDYISNQNSYAGNKPKWIVIHNTDNFKSGANAKAHAKAQHDGNFQGMSAHAYTDDSGAYEAMPADRGAWHVGVNYGGRLFGVVNNRNSYGIEMCVNAGYNYEKAFQNTVELCKLKMKELGIDASHVASHFDVCAKNCPSQIRAKGDWERFKRLIGGVEIAEGTGEAAVDRYYRVRLAWNNSESQIGAYTNLSNAEAECPAGYTVYDWNGKAVYSVPKNGTQASEFSGLSEKAAAEKILDICRPIAAKYCLLPSVAAAQTILESGYCKTELAKKANNVCGMKKNLSGNTWPGSTWNGRDIVTLPTKEQRPDGTEYTINAEFRKYCKIEDSISDRCAYLLGAMNGSEKRYSGIQECKDYSSQITLIREGGYATDVSYINKITKIIEKFDLSRYDSEVTGIVPGEKPDDKKNVVYKVQVGAYSYKANAEKMAKKIKTAGYDAFTRYEDKYYKVQTGSFSVIENAEKMMKELKKKKFPAIIKEYLE